MKCLLSILVFALSIHTHSIAQDRIFKNDKLGWTMTLPAGWAQMPDNMMANMGPMPGLNGDSAGMLLVLMKDRANYLLSFLKKPEPSDGKWEDVQKEQDQRNYDFCTRFAQMSAGSSKSDSSTRYEKISNISFRVFETRAYSPGGQIVLDQLSFTRLVSGNTLTVIIQAGNDMDKKAILDAWRSSVFKNQPVER